MDIETLKRVASDLDMAARCLRHAYMTMKNNGMENEAQKLAKTVLDAGSAARHAKNELADVIKPSGAGEIAMLKKRIFLLRKPEETNEPNNPNK